VDKSGERITVARALEMIKRGYALCMTRGSGSAPAEGANLINHSNRRSYSIPWEIGREILRRDNIVFRHGNRHWYGNFLVAQMTYSEGTQTPIQAAAELMQMAGNLACEK
jgi:hypothetical protein